MILSVIDDFLNLVDRTSSSLKSSYIIIFVLVILILILGSYFKKRDPMQKPSGLGVLVEWYVSWINSMCKELLGPYWKKYAPVIGTLGIIIFVSNIAGLAGLTSPTGNVFITVGLGLFAGFFMHYAGIKHNGFKEYFKSTFLSPSPIMFPLNVISEVLTPFSLALRLFGNILSGSVIMGLLYTAIIGLAGNLSPILGVGLAGIVAPVFHAIFDIFFGAIQTFVFMLLTTVFISGKLPEEE